MNKKTLILLVGIVIAVILLGYFLPTNKTNSNVIKIGYFGPLTGPVAGNLGADAVNGFKLAASINNVVGNKKVEVVYEDDACDPKKATLAAQKLINVDKVNILVSGVCSGSTLAAAPIAESNKVILLTPISTAPKITDAGDYVFRTSGSSVATAQAVSKIVSGLGYKHIAILFETADYTVGWKDALSQSFTSISGNTVVATEGFASADTDVRTQLTKLAQTKSDLLVILPNSTVTANIVINQIKDLNIKLPIVGDEYLSYPQIVSNPNAEGAYATMYKFDSSSLALQNMLSAFQNTYGKTPNTDVYAALAYDGYNVLFNAMKTCNGDDSECIKQALYNTKDFPGVLGPITIDKNGDTAREFTLKKITNGELVNVQ